MSNNNDRWSALSLKDRADLMNMYITNGISDLKEMKKHYNSFSGEENIPEKLISRKEYLDNQRQIIIDKSLKNSNERTDPDVPKRLKYASELDWRKSLEDKINYNKDLILSYTPLDLLNLSNQQEKKRLLEENEVLKNELSKGYKEEWIDGASCIYTATGNFGDDYKCSWNVWFRENPEKYGFTEVNLKEVKPGDIIQDFTNAEGIPNHALTFIGYDNTGKAKYNYSSGGNDSKAIRKEAYYPFELENNQDLHFTNKNAEDLKHAIAAYRFVGNKEDNDRWNSEYLKYRQNYENNWLDTAKQVSWNESPKLLVDTSHSKTILSGEENHPIDVQQGLQNGTIKAIKKDDGTYAYIRQEKPIEDLTQSIAEWTAAGDLMDAGIAIDAVRKGDLKQAALLAGLAVVPNALENTVKLGRRVITHNLHPDKLNAILKGKWDKKMANPSMAIRNIEDITTQEYGPITFLGKPEMLDDSFIFRGDGETSMVSALGLTDVPDVEEVSKIMREYDAKQHSFEYNEPLTKEEVISNVDLTPSWMGYMEAKRSVPTSPKDFERAFIFTGDYKYDPQIQETLELFRNEGIPYTIYGGRGESLPQAVEGYINRNNPNLLFNNGGKL